MTTDGDTFDIRPGTHYAGAGFAGRSPVLARNGMAATSHPLASAVAVDMLKQGGSAIDAAIAANAMLALVEPHMCGLGGDLFAIVYDPETRALAGYNGSGRSPRDLSFAALSDLLGSASRMPETGPLAISVPGAVDGWYALHGRYGRLPMATLLDPAINYAREGFAVTEVVARIWSNAFAALRSASDPAAWSAELERVFTLDGRVPVAGDIFANPDLAASYEALAAGGRDAFYAGDFANRIANAVGTLGGRLQTRDFAAHRGEWVDPVSVNYRGLDVYELPPNGQGIAVLQMLKMLEAWPLAGIGRSSADFWHLLIEVKKLAYEDRARYYADPAFGAADFARLLTEDYAATRRARVDLERAAQTIPAGEPPRDGDTTYLATADSSGMMVSFIQSNYFAFGSRVVPEGLGFALQNRGGQFSLEPGHANVYAPGKRPFHTIIPGFLMQGDTPLMAFGVMGGETQPQGHVQVLINQIDFGMNVQEAGDAARFAHTGSSEPTGSRISDGGLVMMEAGIPASVADTLRARGHRVDHGLRKTGAVYGGYQAIRRDPETGVYHGGSEMRFDGAALGY